MQTCFIVERAYEVSRLSQSTRVGAFYIGKGKAYYGTYVCMQFSITKHGSALYIGMGKVYYGANVWGYDR